MMLAGTQRRVAGAATLLVGLCVSLAGLLVLDTPLLGGWMTSYAVVMALALAYLAWWLRDEIRRQALIDPDLERQRRASTRYRLASLAWLPPDNLPTRSDLAPGNRRGDCDGPGVVARTPRSARRQRIRIGDDEQRSSLRIADVGMTDVVRGHAMRARGDRHAAEHVELAG